MKENINATVLLGFNKLGEVPQSISFTTNDVRLITIDETTQVLNITNDDGINISIQFTKG